MKIVKRMHAKKNANSNNNNTDISQQCRSVVSNCKLLRLKLLQVACRQLSGCWRMSMSIYVYIHTYEYVLLLHLL